MATEYSLVTQNGTGGSYWASLSAAQKNRYLISGSSYRCYATMGAAAAAINGFTSDFSKTIWIEVEGAWVDTASGSFNNKWRSIIISTHVNGVRSSGFHGGIKGAGYRLTVSGQFDVPLTISNANSTIDGLELNHTYAGTTQNAITTSGMSLVKNTIATAPIGFKMAAAGTNLVNCIAIGCSQKGYVLAPFVGGGAIAANCLAVGCGTGFDGSSSNTSVVGCIAVANTTNWGTAPTNCYMSNNIGEAGNTVWGISALTTGTTGMFANYAGNNFYPSGPTAVQVETITLADGDGLPRYDMVGKFRPDYVSATYPANLADAGPLEYDHGEGNVPPNIHNLAVNGLVAGSTVRFYDSTTSTVLFNGVVAGTSKSYALNTGILTHDITITARKVGYVTWETATSISSSDVTLLAAQIVDPAWNASYNAGMATDWSINTGTKRLSVNTTNRNTVQDWHSYWNYLFATAAYMQYPVPTIAATKYDVSIINGYVFDLDTEYKYLKTGSVTETTTDDLYASLLTLGNATTEDIYVVQNGAAITSYWPAGNIDILIKVKAAGALIDSGDINIFCRDFGRIYDHASITITEGGKNYLPMATGSDSNNQTASATVATYNDITLTESPVSKDIGDGTGAHSYLGTINCAGRTKEQVFEYLKYITRRTSAFTVGGVLGGLFVKLGSATTEVKNGPIAEIVGGLLFAQNWWVENIHISDELNYVVIDTAGGEHQKPAPPVQILVTNIASSTVTAIQIFDLTNNMQLDVGYVTGSIYTLVKSWTEDLDIRVRIMGFSGATAYEFYEGQGTFTAAGMSLRASQVPDEVYNANGVDGSTITGVTINDGLLLVEVDTGSISWQELYAYETYWLSTTDGIIDEGRFAKAIDVANYLWYDFKLKNVTSPTVPLVVTGGYGKDGATGVSLNMIDTSGGTIIMAPDHVVPYAAGAEATVAIVQAGLTAQGYSTARAPKLDNLDVAVSSVGGGGGSGGLTAEQDAQLMKTLTVSKFIALK